MGVFCEYLTWSTVTKNVLRKHSCGDLKCPLIKSPLECVTPCPYFFRLCYCRCWLWHDRDKMWTWWSWWRHELKTFSVVLALFKRYSPVTGEFPSHRPVTWSFDISFDLRLNKRLSKPSRRWWFETSLWLHCNDANADSVIESLSSATIWGN